MLADNRIEFFDLHFFGHGFFIFGRGVEVACAFAGNKFYFIAHCSVLLDFGVFADVDENGVYAFFVDDSHTFGRYPQTNPAVFAFNPESMVLQIRKEAAFGSVVGV
jgi:hypothetical protein